ncbi:hypothetical protein D9758_015224 [Tetrapyrgos nigripes]|uniref:Uncharacterized protein n=1 Tax=Tetrapyrgos nigripes TaxID=182062 RepID=A0A8H5FNC2_9AGAR|nr:hypothetical protein D9758_015224 [Tetrapyrgos nigripes]
MTSETLANSYEGGGWVAASTSSSLLLIQPWCTNDLRVVFLRILGKNGMKGRELLCSPNTSFSLLPLSNTNTYRYLSSSPKNQNSSAASASASNIHQDLEAAFPEDENTTTKLWSP